jgi:tryptophan-rich sensory protein
LVLGGLVLLCAAVAAAGSYFTAPEIPTWYAGLNKPAWVPPNAAFPIAWTTLYLLMAVAAWLAWREGGPGAPAALALFAAQLALNFAWSPLFFRLHWIGLAFADIVVLWVAILATTVQFWRVRPLAGVLLLPYLGWVTFAAALTLAIWRLNP